MERREFLKLLFIGVGVGAAAAPADAFTMLAPLAEPDRSPDQTPTPPVASPEDVDGVEIQKAYYYRRYYHRYYHRPYYHPYYGHRRRVYRRYRRRAYRRYRRRYYY